MQGLLRKALSREVLLGTLGVVVFLICWWLALELGLVDRSSAAGPGATLAEVFPLLGDSEFQRHIAVTLQAWFLSMLLATVVAVPIGVVFAYYQQVYVPSEVAVHAIRSVPATALIPVSVLIFGLGMKMQVALTTFAIVWPILFNTMYGVHHTERQQLLIAKQLRWGAMRTLLRVIVPAASSSILTGIRIASGLAMVVVISVQILGAQEGIGTMMIRYENAGQHAEVYAAIVIASAMGGLLYTALSRLEHGLTPWATLRKEQS